ncbi:MAG TPA: patatin-like phospholipase family protein [Longimicrobiales bacterium]|nr:patatin-like phospholipase family protein [Longimicrobiales bacterium]
MGLALGGGAVLGFAHVGTLLALEEGGIPVDRIAGTSAGAIAAALYAFGVPPDRMRELVAPLTWRKVSRFSANSMGLLSNAAIARVLHAELGDVTIEEAAIPLSIVTADIHTGDPVVLQEGPLGPAVRASTAIPGIYAPVTIDGHTLVDGGIVENVPVQPLRTAGSDVVIAATLGEALDFQPVRTMVGVLTNAFLIAVNTATRLHLREGVDVLIEPSLEVYNHWDMKQADELIRKGEEAGRAALPAIRRALAGKQATG